MVWGLFLIGEGARATWGGSGTSSADIGAGRGAEVGADAEAKADLAVGYGGMSPEQPSCPQLAWEGTQPSPAGDGEGPVFPQECPSHQQVLSTVRQMQKLLSAQEAAHLQGTRSLKKQLSVLHSRIQRLAGKHNGNTRRPHRTSLALLGSNPGIAVGSHPQPCPSVHPQTPVRCWRCP